MHGPASQVVVSTQDSLLFTITALNLLLDLLALTQLLLLVKETSGLGSLLGQEVIKSVANLFFLLLNGLGLSGDWLLGLLNSSGLGFLLRLGISGGSSSSGVATLALTTVGLASAVSSVHGVGILAGLALVAIALSTALGSLDVGTALSSREGSSGTATSAATSAAFAATASTTLASAASVSTATTFSALAAIVATAVSATAATASTSASATSTATGGLGTVVDLLELLGVSSDGSLLDDDLLVRILSLVLLLSSSGLSDFLGFHLLGVGERRKSVLACHANHKTGS